MNGAVPLTWKARATATGFAHPHPVDLVSGGCGGMDGGCRVAESSALKSDIECRYVFLGGWRKGGN